MSEKIKDDTVSRKTRRRKKDITSNSNNNNNTHDDQKHVKRKADKRKKYRSLLFFFLLLFLLMFLTVSKTKRMVARKRKRQKIAALSWSLPEISKTTPGQSNPSSIRRVYHGDVYDHTKRYKLQDRILHKPRSIQIGDENLSDVESSIATTSTTRVTKANRTICEYDNEDGDLESDSDDKEVKKSLIFGTRMQQQFQEFRNMTRHKKVDINILKIKFLAKKQKEVLVRNERVGRKNAQKNDHEDPLTIKVAKSYNQTKKYYKKKKEQLKVKELNIKRAKKEYKQPKPMFTDLCEPQHKWQISFHPTCNSFHEHDLRYVFTTDGKQYSHDKSKSIITSMDFAAKGYFRYVWKISDFIDNNDHVTGGNHDRVIDNNGGGGTTTTANYNNNWIVMKTLRYTQNFDPMNYDRHQLDSIANDKLTFSPYVSTIYGACATSSFYEYASGGSLEDLIFKNKAYNNMNSSQKLILAYQTVMAVRDTHYTDGPPSISLPTIAHTDLKAGQYIYVPKEGIMKLTDYNRCRLLLKKRKTFYNKQEVCKFTYGINKGKYRSPEEYSSKAEDEKVDTYSVGNIIYSILTGRDQFDTVSEERVFELVKNGTKPVVSKRYMRSKDTATKAMVTAMYMCWEFDAKERPTSYEVANYLKKQLIELNILEHGQEDTVPRFFLKK